MHIYHPDLLKKCFAGYDPNHQSPGSLWIRKVA